jgi:hypothetical protein
MNQVKGSVTLDDDVSLVAQAAENSRGGVKIEKFVFRAHVTRIPVQALCS